MKISGVTAYQVLDSRGRPTVAASITLDDGSKHTARVPSGASTGRHEAKEIRDGQSPLSNKFYGGKSVNQTISNINSIIAPALAGQEISLVKIDQILTTLDSTQDHSHLGANATLAVSVAAAIAEAASHKKSLARFFKSDGPLTIPMPMINILSGGAHAGKTIDIQDVLVIPHGASSFAEAISWVVAIREAAAMRGAQDKKITYLIADEGGLGIPFASINDACTFIVNTIESVGLTPGRDVSIGMDIAATQFFIDGRYHLVSEGKNLSAQEFGNYLLALLNNFPIISLEDPFAEDDWASWQDFLATAPKGVQIVGDDLLTTNLDRLSRAIDEKSANAILIKPNQNGLLTSTFEVLHKAQKNGFRTIVSARSGETEDSWLADLATGWNAQQIKVGSTHGSDRTAKWNRLLELESTEETIFANLFAHLT